MLGERDCQLRDVSVALDPLAKEIVKTEARNPREEDFAHFLTDVAQNRIINQVALQGSSSVQTRYCVHEESGHICGEVEGLEVSSEGTDGDLEGWDQHTWRCIAIRQLDENQRMEVELLQVKDLESNSFKDDVVRLCAVHELQAQFDRPNLLRL